MKFDKSFKDEIRKEDFNYCAKQWQNFTLLNEQERLNLDKIEKYIAAIKFAKKKAIEIAKKAYKEAFNRILTKARAKKDGRFKTVYDKTDNIFYASHSDCAKALGVSIAWVARCIKDGYKARGHVLMEVDYGR